MPINPKTLNAILKTLGSGAAGAGLGTLLEYGLTDKVRGYGALGGGALGAGGYLAYSPQARQAFKRLIQGKDTSEGDYDSVLKELQQAIKGGRLHERYGEQSRDLTADLLSYLEANKGKLPEAVGDFLDTGKLTPEATEEFDKIFEYTSLKDAGRSMAGTLVGTDSPLGDYKPHELFTKAFPSSHIDNPTLGGAADIAALYGIPYLAGKSKLLSKIPGIGKAVPYIGAIPTAMTATRPYVDPNWADKIGKDRAAALEDSMKLGAKGVDNFYKKRLARLATGNLQNAAVLGSLVTGGSPANLAFANQKALSENIEAAQHVKDFIKNPGKSGLGRYLSDTLLPYYGIKKEYGPTSGLAEDIEID
jgi:hypothetical protein